MANGWERKSVLIAISVMLGAGAVQARQLTIEDRVRAQEAIERVYYTHQIGTRRSFEEAVPRVVLDRKVRTYLRQSAALESFWKTPVTADMLRKELERISERTRMPDRLREVEAALSNDAFLIEECLARPALVDRLTRSFFAGDATIHAKARREAEELREDLVSGRRDPRSEGPGRIAVELEPDEFEHDASRFPAHVGEIGPVQDEPEAFVVRVVLDRSEDRIRAATVVVPKLPWDAWWASVEPHLAEALVAAVAPSGDLLPDATGPACIDDVWDASTLNTPSPRRTHTAVWTGSLMILWGGSNGTPLQSGARYDPATDTWSPTSLIDAPSARWKHTAVWTGDRMIVWGGDESSTLFEQVLQSGGRYDPATDTWTPTSLANVPPGRARHTAVWTGSVMVAWGGGLNNGGFASGGRYDPVADSWMATSLAGAPSGRVGHSAIWTGALMIVWGGSGLPADLDSGARYDPFTDTWSVTSTTNAPAARRGHNALWTGTTMVVWGGIASQNFNTGGRYDPAGDTWTPTSTLNAPIGGVGVTAVWTGSEMIVWGGFGSGGVPISGGRYDPATDTWARTATTNAPSPRTSHSAVWASNRMIVWGGNDSGRYLETGGRYDPVTDSWTPTSTGTAPQGRAEHTAVWTGNLMIVWGGTGGPDLGSGGRYDPVNDTWTPTSTTAAPTARQGHTATWTGNLIVVWGGSNGGNLDTGSRYDPIADTWAPTSSLNAPQARRSHTAVWSGDVVLIWGGFGGTDLDTGARYDPAADTWSSISAIDAPAARSGHVAVWTGDGMLVWGGHDATGYAQSGGRYEPTANQWTAMSLAGAPTGRVDATAVWTGRLLIVWGGYDGAYRNTGGRYDPSTNTWSATGTPGAPSARARHTAASTGNLMVVWGGDNGLSFLGTGARYDPATNLWKPTSTVGAPSGRHGHSVVWTGTRMLVWGGIDGNGYAHTGGGYAVDPSFVDGDSDGFSTCLGDCDDSRPNVYPGAAEACDGLDNDCNGIADGFVTHCGVGHCASSGLCQDGVDGCAPGSPSPEVCDGGDNNCNGLTDDVPTPAGSPVVTIQLSASAPDLTWGPLPGATAFDVVTGNLTTLSATGGDFTAAMAACLAHESTATSLAVGDLPAPGTGFFYLVRGVNCGGVGTFDSDDPAQVGSCDVEISASPFACENVPPPCGDFVCEDGEDCFSCPFDCGDCCPFCGG